jgi:hypothetical protein
MECGKIYDNGRIAQYASGVMDASPEELVRFYERVNKWAHDTDIVLGEGTVVPQPNTSENPFPVNFVLRAPVIRGDIDRAFYVAIDPIT